MYLVGIGVNIPFVVAGVDVPLVVVGVPRVGIGAPLVAVGVSVPRNLWVFLEYYHY
jgi:sugar (pentulose or hexulose) kinase